MPFEERLRQERAAYLKIEIITSSLLLVVFLIAAGVGFYLLENEQDARIREQTRIRNTLVRGLEIVLVNQCRQIEQLKAGARRDARRQFQRLPETLALLGIEETPQIIAAARDQRDADLARYRAKTGGCGEYPPPID